jgi:hypothetical protein
VRVTESSLFCNTVADRQITATSVDFNGRSGYGLAGPTATSVLDPASFNPIERISGGKAAS